MRVKEKIQLGSPRSAPMGPPNMPRTKEFEESPADHLVTPHEEWGGGWEPKMPHLEAPEVGGKPPRPIRRKSKRKPGAKLTTAQQRARREDEQRKHIQRHGIIGGDKGALYVPPWQRGGGDDPSMRLRGGTGTPAPQQGGGRGQGGGLRHGGRGAPRQPRQPTDAEIDAHWRAAGYELRSQESQEESQGYETLPERQPRRERRRKKHSLEEIATAVFEKVKLARGHAPVPVQMPMPYPMPMPMPIPSQEQGAKKAKDDAKIIIKQTVRQEVNIKKARKRATNTVAKLRKEYNIMKKTAKKDFRKLRSLEYKKRTKELKGTKSEKAAKRKSIQQYLQKKLKGVFDKMTTSVRKDSKQLDKMISDLRKLKW